MNIRPVTADDLPFLRKMMYEAARWNPDWPREPMEEVLAEPILLRYSEGWGRHGDGGVIAEIEGEPVGAAWYRLFEAGEPGYGFVDEETPELTIAIVPSRRGKGLGEQLLTSLLDQARKEGYARISLSVEPDNPAIRLYEQHGFERVGERAGAWVMRAALS